MSPVIPSGPEVRGKALFTPLDQKEQTVRQQINQLQQKSDRKLFEVATVFPFDFFPDRIIIDDHKLDIVYGEWFFTRSIFPVFIKDIRTVTIHTGLFLGEIEIELIGYEKNPHKITNLWRKDVIRLRRIIIGLIAIARQGIDTSLLPVNELMQKVEEIGTATDAAGTKL